MVKISKMFKITKNGQLAKNQSNGIKWLKWSKSVKSMLNCQRGVQRTKSSGPEGLKAGPKGRQLEVCPSVRPSVGLSVRTRSGARRAPRLLVFYIMRPSGCKTQFFLLAPSAAGQLDGS